MGERELHPLFLGIPRLREGAFGTPSFVALYGPRMSVDNQRYRVIQKLEAGGMAEVFRAESEGLQGFKKQVAIKRVLPHLAEKKKFISMFLDEARLSAILSHSNCVQVFDIGVGDNTYFIVMEFVDGANLKAIVESLKKQGREISIPIAVMIAHEICKGLAYAHELRDTNGVELEIVHRDMSPPNVLITKFGEVKIVDFGLAKASSQLEKSEPGIIKGKFSYLSPEAAQGTDVDARTDIFAVGIILWELITGSRLFLGETDFQTVKKVQEAVVPPMATFNRKVQPELDAIVAKSLARDPEQRYKTARDLGRDLATYLFKLGEPVSAFDLANIVATTMKDRSRVRAPQVSIIDKLIEEALLEFTSLKEEDKAAAAALKKATPISPIGSLSDFEDPSKWLNEIQLDAPKSNTSLDANLGNLSALEDEMRTTGGRPIVQGHTPPAPISQASRDLTKSPRLTTPKPLKEEGLGKGAIAGIAGGVLVVLFAALWFLHVIPHK